ncbi:MAG: hypothetical protein R3A45_05075 [Bdellovibrionota bacterium]
MGISHNKATFIDEHSEQALSQAQFEATSRVLWSCITYNQAINTLEIYMDQNADRVCNSGSDYLIGSHVLSTGVGFANCSSGGDGTPFDEGDQSMWFNTSGANFMRIRWRKLYDRQC